MLPPSPPPISPRSNSGPIPLSFAQEQLWFLDQLEPNTSRYNIVYGLRLTGLLDIKALEKAVDAIRQRHEALRTTIKVVDDTPSQYVVSFESIPLPIVDLTALPRDQREDDLCRQTHAEACRPFQLSQEPLFRTTLFKVSDKDFLLLVTLHHIIGDMWSMEILWKELGILYSEEVTEQSKPLPPLRIQPGDFAHWQRRWLQGETLQAQLHPWKEELQGAPTVLELPTDYPRPLALSSEGAMSEHTISPTLLEQVKLVSQQEGMTLFMTVLAGFQLLIQRYAGQEDVIIGIPHAARSSIELEGIIGFFVNTLPIRGQLIGNPSVREYLKQVRTTAIRAYQFATLPFAKLVEHLNPTRDQSRHPLVQVMFQIQNMPTAHLRFHGLQAETFPIDNQGARFDLSVTLSEVNEGLRIRVTYATRLFRKTTIQHLTTHYETLLKVMVENLDHPVRTLPVVDPIEQQAVLAQLKGMTKRFPDQCVHTLFEKQVEHTPEAIAVVCESTALTYKALNGKANQLAQQLQRKESARGQVIPVLINRSSELVIAYLAILKIGGAFAPLDPDWPPGRIRDVLNQLKPNVVLVDQENVNNQRLRSWDTMVVHTAVLQPLFENIRVTSSPEDPAYLIFTSGTTGTPKGAMNQHRGFVNRLWNLQQRYPWSAKDVVLAAFRHTFDASLWQYFWPLLHGARLILPPHTQWFDLPQMIKLIEQEQVTITGWVPSIFQMLVEILRQNPEMSPDLRSLQYLSIGGEVLQADSVTQFGAHCPGIGIIHTYGPTEASISTLMHDVTKPCTDPIPLGQPLNNVSTLILDKGLNLVPVGMPGELFLGGVAVGLGYLNDPQATAANFIPNPYPELGSLRLYKSGDQASLQSDGNIRFLGRRDHQIKINGIRIELKEIENVLQSHPQVARVVIEARDDPSGEKHLVAYIVPSSVNEPLRKMEIRNFLAHHLPTEMIPRAWVLLDHLPLHLNGKVNRQALPQSHEESLLNDEGCGTPTTPWELFLTELWKDVLRVPNIGIHDNFFNLGGHSLTAIKLRARLKKVTNQDISLRTIFEHPTVHELAKDLAATYPEALTNWESEE